MLSLISVLTTGFGLATASLTYKGVDWSSVKVEEDAGITYKTAGGVTEPLEKILAANGVNTVRQRVWVNPSDGVYNLDYNLKLAARAKAAGLGIYVDLHYSDTWADPGHQSIPSGWPSEINDLTWKIYNYTKEVSDAFHGAGIQPSIISIGNEITAGLLFPTGRASGNGYDNIARLLHSAAWGIKDSSLSPKPKIMIHLDNGWNWSTQQYWYNTVLGKGELSTSDFDMMGVSYYPFYNSDATLSSLRSSLNNMASKWGKEIAVVETNWPISCPNPGHAMPSDARSIPISAAGQSTWIKDVASVVSGVKNGVGLFYWEPAWLQNAGLGSSCADNLMFSTSGKTGTALSSLSVFKEI